MVENWDDWRYAVPWAANEWAPGQIARDDFWGVLEQDFERWILDTFMIRKESIDFQYRVTNYVNNNMPRVQEWALNWMINHGYGQSGYYTK